MSLWNGRLSQARGLLYEACDTVILYWATKHTKFGTWAGKCNRTRPRSLAKYSCHGFSPNLNYNHENNYGIKRYFARYNSSWARKHIVQHDFSLSISIWHTVHVLSRRQVWACPYTDPCAMLARLISASSAHRLDIFPVNLGRLRL
jgi:hypothetical protein